MWLKPKSLAARMSLLLVSILLITAISFGVTAYMVTKGILETLALDKLNSLATAKRNAIEDKFSDYLTKQHAYFTFALEQEVVKALLPEVGDDIILSQNRLRSHLRGVSIMLEEIDRVEVVGPDGVVVISTDRSREETSVSYSMSFQKGLLRENISDISVDEGNIYVYTSGPIFDDVGETLAVIMLRINASGILSITGEYTGLGETGETVLGARRGNKVHFLAPLRFDPDLSTIRPASASGERARPMIHATSRQSGTIRAHDYRDVNVVAAFRPLETTGWGIVVKQDEEEIFAGIRKLREYLVLATLFLITVCVALVLPVVRRFTRPVTDLVDATNAVATGRLDTEVSEIGDEEIVKLARSFNNMVKRLKEAQEELSISNSSLKEQSLALSRSQKDMETFVYSISHDLKTPVVSIRGMVDMLKDDLGDKLTGDPKIYLEHIDNSILRMNQLIQDVLEMSRVGRIDTTPEQINTEKIVKDVIAHETRALSDDRSVEFVVAQDLPDAYCNAKRLHQIFSNLINNALKFTAGVPNARIEIGWKRPQKPEDKKGTLFFVTDNGPGIQANDQEKIFDMFRRLHGPEVEGTGMGLAFIKSILASIGGSICVQSSVGDGTTFFFTIPRKGEDS